MVYVTMTDKFMSEWGLSEGRINKLIFECETQEDAEAVAGNAEARGDMKYINICTRKPRYSSARYYTQVKTKEDYPAWYKPNYFLKQRVG